jgi:hypothetical protein
MQTQATIDANIGDENYDIGHNLQYIPGGNAGCIGCVCTSGTKGWLYRWVKPTGDSLTLM